ncbi:MAG: tetratricopeptide repeat protein [Tardiphaga sp.]
MRQPSCLARLFSTAATLTILTVGLAGCKTAGLSDITGSIGGKSERAEADPVRAIDALGEKFRANPKDGDVALRYGQALRASGQRSQAVAVFEQATLLNPGNKALLAGYGRALADTGSFQRAFEVLNSAHTPANPDWRILSVQGAVLDQMGRHDEARRYYGSALKIRPDEPSVLSNLGLSYMLAKDLPKAEATLRQAYGGSNADPRVRQNLGLVVGLQGRFGEAETIVKADLPPDEAAANVAYLKQMLSSKSPPLGAPSDDVRARS